MPLPSNPSRDDIWAELEESNFRNGGTNVNGLKDMHTYVFSTGSYSRDGFGGYGKPTIASSISGDGGDEIIDVTFTINNTGGFTTTAVVEYWEDDGSQFPNTTFETLGTFGSSGTYERTFGSTPLTNGQQYKFRVLLYNKFNNSGGYTSHPYPDNDSANWDYSNTATATPELPTLVAVNSFYVNSYEGGGEYALVWNHPNADADFEIQHKYDDEGSYSTGIVSNKTQWGTTNNPKSCHYDTGVNFPTANVTFRIRAVSPNYQSSSWQTATWNH